MPDEHHVRMNDYPLAPEKMMIDQKMISPYSRRLFKNLFLKSSKVEKLVPTLLPKKKYVVHYRNLQFYLEQGMVLEKIHRILAFKQSRWLAQYIQYNTDMRTKAKNSFEKDYYKLLNNAYFGKTMENVRKRINVILVTEAKRLKKLVSKPNYEDFIVFHEHLLGVRLKQETLKLNKPIYIGFSVLELSKLAMFEFHYRHMKPKYGDNLKLCFTDTDSLLYEITTDDVYKDMQEDSHLYDTSDYPTTHSLHSNKNKKIPGLMKDEMNGAIIEEFVGLRAKMYSVKLFGGKELKKAKGVPKMVVDKEIQHDNYKRSLLQQWQTNARFNTIQSKRHQLRLLEMKKKSLCPGDDKRWVCEDGFTTLAHGHYQTIGEPEDEDDEMDIDEIEIEDIDEIEIDDNIFL